MQPREGVKRTWGFESFTPDEKADNATNDWMYSQSVECLYEILLDVIQLVEHVNWNHGVGRSSRSIQTNIG